VVHFAQISSSYMSFVIRLEPRGSVRWPTEGLICFEEEVSFLLV
jgi:hypothetical protein